MIDPLSIERFLDLVASYGADPDRWPADQRSGAVCCLAGSVTARNAWREAADLDTDLDSMAGHHMSSELTDRVLAIAGTPEVHAAGRLTGTLRYALPYAAAAAIALIVGLAAPSPFRDTAGTTPPDEAAVIEASDEIDINDGLTTLALVDVRTFADDEIDADDDLDSGNQLSELPLL